MIQCDVCDLVVRDVTYCSDACKQKAYRERFKKEGFGKIKGIAAKPMGDGFVPEEVEIDPSTIKGMCKHGAMVGLCKHGCK